MATSTQTDLTARTFRSALVGLCSEPECGVYLEPYQRKEECPNMCERPGAGVYGQQYRLLRKRRMILCSRCETAFFTQEGAEEHDCDHWLV